MTRNKQIGGFLIAAVLLFGMLCVTLDLCISGNDAPVFTGVAAEYREELIQKGFPEDYADDLTLLHLLHPTWEFEPLRITQLKSTYTWNYVIDKETEEPETSLIAPQADYAAYRHPLNANTYDSGFYQASTQTVRYFMDPRNFLNEADIFQFYELSATSKTSAAAVDAVLAGTFMEDAELENGKTYTEYLLELEHTLGIDPVYLAVKLRQEQGTAGSSPIISGKCGSLLLSYYQNQTQYTDGGNPINPPKSGENEDDLLALNGYYNPFNFKASGNGVYAIYKNAMEYAAKNGWSTMWQGIYGGAAQIEDRYINRYQSTVYLQKFNIDPRAGEKNNFSFQYMQNIAGAFSEGRLLYQSFAANDMLDAPCKFSIPVFDGMSDTASPDPANGSCTLYKPASDRYKTTASLTAPLQIEADQKTLFASARIAYNQSLSVKGSVTHSYGMIGLKYAWDDGEWNACAANGTLNLSLPCHELSYGEHILLIRGEAAYANDISSRKQNRYFLAAVITVTVTPPPSAEVSFQEGSTLNAEKHYVGDSLRLPASTLAGFAGWLGSDGSFLPAGETVTVTGDAQYTAIQLRLCAKEGASVGLLGNTDLRFYATAPNADLQTAEALPADTVRIMARLSRNNTVSAPVEATVWNEQATLPDQALHRKISVDTPAISKSDRDDRWSAEFFWECRYTNGTTGTVAATGSTSTRSASQVAYAALADRRASYSEEMRLALQQIVT